jgi:hypothetical protein
VSTKQKNKLEYYDLASLLSRNGAYNFLVGARGLGKTYSAKKRAITDFLKNGNQFIYLRRYDTELRVAKHTLFTDLTDEFPDYEFQASGDSLKLRKKSKEEKNSNKWMTCGYAIPLSKAQQKKSVSYHNVTLIIFDEFIIEKGAVRYLPSEAKLFNDFYSTVDRYQDKTKVLFLANSISIMNPYFLEYDIKPAPGKEWIKKYNGFIIAHFPTADAFANSVFQTRFGQFIKGTEYADYAVGSVFTDNSDALIKSKSSNADYICTLITDGGTFTVWVDWSDASTFYIQQKRPKLEQIWVMRPEEMAEGRILVDYTNPVLARLRSAYANGKAWFDIAQSRNAFAGIYKR